MGEMQSVATISGSKIGGSSLQECFDWAGTQSSDCLQYIYSQQDVLVELKLENVAPLPKCAPLACIYTHALVREPTPQWVRILGQFASCTPQSSRIILQNCD